MALQSLDLMIGDWVYIKDYPMIKSPQRIRPEHFVRSLVDFEPIPLTPEILEKNGFETQPNIGYIIDDCDGTQIIYDSWNHNLRINKNYKVCLDIEAFDDIAVHELQHALKLCGIEKEIEL